MEINKKNLRWLSQILVSIIIFYLIFREIDIRDIVSNFIKIPLSLIIVLFFLMALKSVFQLLNWYHFLKLNKKYKTDVYEIIKTFFIGNALKFFLPGGYATFGKAFFLNNSKKASFISVAFEKFIVSWINILTFFIGLLFYFDKFSRQYSLMMVGIIIILPFIIPLFKNFFSKEEHKSYFKQYSKKIFVTIFFQSIQKLITVYQYYLLLNFFSRISFMKNLIASFIVLGANTIPITFSGLGLRESFAMNIYPKYGILSGIAISTSLIIFFINSILPSLPGLFFIIKKQSAKN